jgi:UDP-N-acetylglucosamine--N-acetylmuramyl-(pentapeptide) pyrophosphoryl-undecaprenol N-acetylglucosamine transferase
LAGTNEQSGTCIVLAAGGTGGHLFPAYALAEELGRRGYAVDLATDERGDRYGVGFPGRNIYRLSSATLGGRSPFAVLRTLWLLGKGIRQAHRLFARLKPAVVVGFGGYPSFPPLFAASIRRIPTALHEQNAVLGRANRILARRVTTVATSFEKVRYLDGPLAEKAVLTGNPVRDAVLQAARRPYEPPVPDGPVRVLVFGGSQGARFFSETVPPALAGFPEEMRARLEITQQCRPEDLHRARRIYADAGIAAQCDEFFADLPARIAAAHLVVARAGASTIAELTTIGRPALLVPLPHALDNDQLLNATSLAEIGGAWCVVQAELSAERLRTELASLLGDPARLSESADAARSAGRADAVIRLADLVERLDAGHAALAAAGLSEHRVQE